MALSDLATSMKEAGIDVRSSLPLLVASDE